jgi:hypothetical protein
VTCTGCVGVGGEDEPQPVTGNANSVINPTSASGRMVGQPSGGRQLWRFTFQLPPPSQETSPPASEKTWIFTTTSFADLKVSVASISECPGGCRVSLRPSASGSQASAAEWGRAEGKNSSG